MNQLLFKSLIYLCGKASFLSSDLALLWTFVLKFPLIYRVVINFLVSKIPRHILV